MTVLVGLPILAFALLLSLLRRRCASMRVAILGAALIWAVALTFMTEALSRFSALALPGVAAGWALVVAVLAVLTFRRRVPSPAVLPVARLREWPGVLRFALAAMVVIVLVIGLIAVIAPPNTWDAMAYHMARVAHWVENRTLRHYPTCFLPQLYHGPWAEFAITHLQILSGGDRFANCVQWCAMIGSLLGVSLIAQELGASLRGQVLAAVVAATIPMGVLQGSSTQNDHVTAWWLVCFAWFALRWFRAPPKATSQEAASPEATSRERTTHALAMGASLGLALLTKGTAYLYALPFIVWLGIMMLHRYRLGAWREVSVIAGLAVLINVGHYQRNWEMFGTPIATGIGQENYANEICGLNALASNVVRNVSLHVGTPLASVNDETDHAVRAFHAVIGMDVDDPRTTSWGKFAVRALNTFEDSAGNPVHLLLIIGTIIVFLFSRTIESARVMGIYLALVLTTFLLFSALLKWQPWHSRLQLPLFILFAPFVGVILARIPAGKLANLTVVSLILSCLPWLMFNKTRLLVPATFASDKYQSVFAASRTDQYFSNYSCRYLKEPYLAARAYLAARGITDIGLKLPYDPWEYQLWVLLQGMRPGVRLTQVDVHNISALKSRIEPAVSFTPRAIVCVRARGERPREEMRIADGVYVRRWSQEPVDIYLPP